MSDYPSIGEYGVVYIITAGQFDHNQLFALYYNIRVQSKTVPGPAINYLQIQYGKKGEKSKKKFSLIFFYDSTTLIGSASTDRSRFVCINIYICQWTSPEFKYGHHDYIIGEEFQSRNDFKLYMKFNESVSVYFRQRTLA